MRITRRRKRQTDPFASPDWVRSVFAQLKAIFPLLSSLKEKDMIRLARAVRHVERYSATDTRRGRPSRWPREDLVRVGLTFADLLRRETSGRMSLASFVDHYLRILDFPADVLEALSSSSVNLFEAEQLARIKPGRLDLSASETRRKRTEILSAHLKSRASGERLRQRVNELLVLRKPESNPSAPVSNASVAYENLEDFDPYDSTHLFWEEIKQLGFAFRDIRREDLTDELIEELLRATQPLWAVLTKIQRRRQVETIKISL
ncbi:MAG: hypothetical protein ACJ74J_04855 [Blastocatellia bacterium]